MHPLHIINHEDVVYTSYGKAVPPQAIGQDVTVSSVLMAVNSVNGEIDKKSLSHAKSFALKYAVPALHNQIEEHIKFSFKPWKIEKGIPKDFQAMHETLSANYREKGEAGYSERCILVEQWVKQFLETVTVEKALDDMDRVELEAMRYQNAGAESIMDIFSQRHGAFAEGDKNKAASTNALLGKILKRMPEWMQILTHDSGAYVFTTGSFTSHQQEAGASLSDNSEPGTMGLFMNPLIYRSAPPPAQDRALREELLHELQTRTDMKQNLRDDGTRELLLNRLNNAAELVLEKMDSDPNHPALQLIRKTEGEDSSVMLPQLRDNLDARSRELVVDLFDAEILLRKTEKKDPEEAKAEIIAAFGQNLYDISREYLTLWMDEAATIAKGDKNIGEKKAEELRAKWENDPFHTGTHITITNKSPYNLTHPELPDH